MNLNSRIERLERKDEPEDTNHAAGAARVRARIESMAPNLRASPEFREMTPEETAATRAMLEEVLG